MFKRIINFIKKKKIILLSLFFLAGGFFFGNRILSSQKEPPYETAQTQKKDLVISVSASGEIESEEEATLKFQTSGELTWVGVEKGDRVEKWQAIASLNKEKLQKELQKELLDYMDERWTFEETTQETYKDQALTEVIRIAQEQAQFDLSRDVLDVEIANVTLKYATLITPIAGIVTQIDAPHAGINITPATAQFIIANPEKMVFYAHVDEIDIGQVKQGQTAEILLDAYPEEKINSQVAEVEFSSITTSGGGTAFRVKFCLPANTPDQKFKLGMNGDAEIFIQKVENALTVPFEAIQEKNGEKYVWLISEEKPRKQIVQTGSSDDFNIQVKTGLQPKDRVVI